jgi:succinate-acetate transporter protein
MNKDEHEELSAPAPKPGAGIANPAPLGLAGFALTTFVLSLFNIGAGKPGAASGPSTLIIGLAVAYGGTAQFAAGMWEFVKGNTFGATAFTSYGAFWISFALIFIPGFDSLATYETTDPKTGDVTVDGSLGAAIGIYLLAWGLFTFILFLASFRLNAGTVLLFFLLTTTFIILAIANFVGSDIATKIGGVFGVLTALNAWYLAAAGLFEDADTYFRLPNMDLRKSK